MSFYTLWLAQLNQSSRQCKKNYTVWIISPHLFFTCLCYRYTGSGYEKDLTRTEWKSTTPPPSNSIGVSSVWYSYRRLLQIYLSRSGSSNWILALAWHGMAPRAKCQRGYMTQHERLHIRRHTSRVAVGERGPQLLVVKDDAWQLSSSRWPGGCELSPSSPRCLAKCRRNIFENKYKDDGTQPLRSVIQSWSSYIQSKLVWFSLHQSLDYSVNFRILD